MAVTVLLNPQIVVNSVDLTNHVTTVKIEEAFEAVDVTAFGAGGKEYAAGLGDNKISIDFQQDFAAASVDATIYPLVGQTTSITIKPLAGTTTTTNPAYVATVLVDSWTPLDGKVGALAVSSVTWPVNGLVTRATS